MGKREHQARLKEALRNLLEKEEKNVLFAYVYGSFGRGEHGFKDIDIAVFLKRVPLRAMDYETKLAKKLEAAAGKPVDVRAINSMPLLLKSRLMKEGALLFSRDMKATLNFETFLMGESLDFSHMMKEFDRRRLERYGIAVG